MTTIGYVISDETALESFRPLWIQINNVTTSSPGFSDMIINRYHLMTERHFLKYSPKTGSVGLKLPTILITGNIYDIV
jgi:hypothetical protein